MKRIIGFIFLFFIYPNFYAQDTKIIDSLVEVIHNKNTADTTLIKAYNDLGIQYAFKDPGQAKAYILKALRIATNTGKARGVAGAQNCLGVVYYYEKEYDSALVWFEKALATNKEIGHLWGQASAMHQLGVIYKYKTNYNKAIAYFLRSGTIFGTLKDSTSLAKSMESVGSCYNLMMYYDKAIEYFLKGIEICEKKKDSLGIGRGYNHIGSLLMNQKKYHRALEYFRKALPIMQKSGNLWEVSANYYVQCYTYTEIGEYDKALEYGIKCLEYRESSGNKEAAATTRVLIGRIYNGLEQYPRALSYLKDALKYYDYEGNYLGKVDAYNALSKSYLMVRQPDSAGVYARKAVTLSKEVHYLAGENKGNDMLARVAEKEGRLDMALKYYKEMVRLRDSLYDVEKQKHADELQVIYETGQKEKQIELQEIKINLLERETVVNRLQRTLLSSGFVLALVIGGLLFYMARQKVKSSQLAVKHSQLEKEKLNEKLAFRTRELTSFAMHLEKKNKVLDQIKTIINTFLRESGKKDKKDRAADYQHLLDVIDAEIKDDDNWEDFKKYFEQVHPGFYAKVKQKYPDLTSGDLRLIILLKMNLSYKEISNILNITPQGVKKARHRLRKKMNIEPEESLLDVVISL